MPEAQKTYLRIMLSLFSNYSVTKRDDEDTRVAAYLRNPYLKREIDRMMEYKLSPDRKVLLNSLYIPDPNQAGRKAPRPSSIFARICGQSVAYIAVRL